MATNRRMFGTLDRLLLIYCFGAAVGVVLFVLIFKALGLLVEIPLFLVPSLLGFHLIGRAYRAGQHRGPQPQTRTR
jgi:UPF0716 family protein affecting phage T7 exclusion